MLLQVEQGMGVFEHLADYGVLGLLTLGLGYTVWYLMKRRFQAEDDLREKYEELEKQMNTYLLLDRDKLYQILEDNTKALENLRDVILKKL